MDESQQLYAAMLEGGKTAFARDMYVASYHALMAAMYCAVALGDISKLLEVQEIANDHYEQLSLRTLWPDSPPPIEVGLYNSLIQMVRSRIILLPRSK